MAKTNNSNISSIYDTTILIEKIYKGTLVVYDGWRKLIKSGVPPLTLVKSKGVYLIDYKIYGNSVQESDNLYDNETMGTRIYAFINVTNGIWRQASDSWSVRIPCVENATYVLSNNNPNNTIFRAGYVTVEEIPSKVNEVPIDIPIYGAQQTTDNSSISITTGEGAKYLICQFGSTQGTETVKTLKVMQTTPTPETPIEVESVGTPTINLYDKNTYPLSNGYVNAGNGVLYSSINYKRTNDFIPVKPNTTYSINYSAGGTNPGIAFYDENETFISGVRNGVGFTTPNNAKYMRFTVKVDVDVDTIQINEGATILEYEPYGYKIPVKVSNESEEIITNIYLNEPLRKLGNYVDYIDFENKKVVRNIGYGEVSSSNTMSNHVNAGTSKSIRIADFDAKALGNEENTCMSNYYMSTMFNPYYNKRTINCCTTHSGTNNIIYVHDEKFTTVAEYGAFFDECKAKGNPVYFIFVKTTPKEETIELPNIPTIKGTTILEVDTDVQPSNMEVTYKGKN